MATETLNFDLNDPDDNMAFMRCAKSTDMALALWEFAYNTKKSFQRELDESDDKSYELIDKVYERFWEILNDKGIKLDDLIN
jgi:hypothetical protein